MKKIIFVFIMSFMVAGLAGCTGNGTDNAGPEQTQESVSEDAEAPTEQDGAANDESAPDTAADIQTDAATNVQAAALVGTWVWDGIPYYTLEANGQGRMAGIEINWSVRSGILAICNTPQVCGDICSFPTEWYYELDGDQLTLTSSLDSTMSFVYTRQ